MARTNAEDVKAILDGCTLDNDDIASFITAANALVTDVFADDTTLGSLLLKEIEKYLTAHIVASTVWRTTDTEKLGDASVKYTGQWGKQLDSTPYGQMVQTLDYTGKIKNAGKRSVSIRAITEFE